MSNEKIKSKRKYKISIVEIIFIVAAVATIISSIVLLSKCPKPAPIFGVKNAVLNAELPIVIIAKNSSARLKKPLDVRWDSINIDQGAIPDSSPDVYEWIFAVKTKNLPGKCKTDGEHKLEVGFDGKFSEPIGVYFSSKQAEENVGGEKILQAYFSLTLSAERVIIEPVPTFLVTPRSFCATEDKVFLIPDIQAEEIAVYEKNDNYLNFRKVLRFTGFDLEKKARPAYCYYSRNERNEGRLGVIDEGLRKIFLYNKTGKFDFSLFKKVDCENLGYDIKFSNDGQQIIVSGFLTDKNEKPFDLYEINVKSGKIDYLLTSQEKYNGKTVDDYILEYKEKKTLPTIGIKAFIDIQGDDLFFVWEGALRIINFNLQSKKISRVFGNVIPRYYNQPNASLELVKLYNEGKIDELQNEKDKMAYIRKIFVTNRHVFLVYETAKTDNSNLSRFRLQMYTLIGQFLGDVSIPGPPSQPMWLDKENYEFYAFSQKPKNENTSFSILKYKIKI